MFNPSCACGIGLGIDSRPVEFGSITPGDCEKPPNAMGYSLDGASYHAITYGPKSIFSFDAYFNPWQLIKLIIFEKHFFTDLCENVGAIKCPPKVS
jgi:hypothetical protein